MIVPNGNCFRSRDFIYFLEIISLEGSGSIYNFVDDHDHESVALFFPPNAMTPVIPPEAILNPYTPLAFLPPVIAYQYEIVGYVYIATLAVSPP